MVGIKHMCEDRLEKKRLAEKRLGLGEPSF